MSQNPAVAVSTDQSSAASMASAMAQLNISQKEEKLNTKKGLAAVWDSIAQGKLLYGRVTLKSQPEKHEADRAEFDHYEDKVLKSLGSDSAISNRNSSPVIGFVSVTSLPFPIILRSEQEIGAALPYDIVAVEVLPSTLIPMWPSKENIHQLRPLSNASSSSKHFIGPPTIDPEHNNSDPLSNQLAKLRSTMREHQAHIAGKVVAILSSDEKILYGTLDSKSSPPLFLDHHTEMAAFIANDQRSVDLMKKYPDAKCWMAEYIPDTHFTSGAKRCTLLAPTPTKRKALDALIQAHHRRLQNAVNTVQAYSSPPAPSPRPRQPLPDSDLVFTIDSFGALTLDDALSLRTLKDGCFEVCVHVPDISAHSAPGDDLDLLMRTTGGSIYSPLQDRLDMLPTCVSEKLSLMPGADRDAITVTFRLHPGGDLMADFEPTVKRTTVRPTLKLAYDQVDHHLAVQAVLIDEKLSVLTPEKVEEAVVKNLFSQKCNLGPGGYQRMADVLPDSGHQLAIWRDVRALHGVTIRRIRTRAEDGGIAVPIHTCTPPAVESKGGGYLCMVQVNVDIAQELLPDRGKQGMLPLLCADGEVPECQWANKPEDHDGHGQPYDLLRLSSQDENRLKTIARRICQYNNHRAKQDLDSGSHEMISECMTLTNGIIAHKLLSHPLTRGATVVNTQEPSVPENVKIWSELMQKIKTDMHTPTVRGMNGSKNFPHPGVPLEVIHLAKYQIQDRFSRTYYGPSGDAESWVIQHHLTTVLPAYAKFTSPLRRYQDVLVHYQIDRMLRAQSQVKTPTPVTTATSKSTSPPISATTTVTKKKAPSTPKAAASPSSHASLLYVISQSRVAGSQLRNIASKMEELAIVSMLLRQEGAYKSGEGLCPFQSAYVVSLDREAEEVEVVMPHYDDGHSVTMSLVDCTYPGATHRWVSDNNVEIEFSKCVFPADRYPSTSNATTLTLVPLAPLWVRLRHTFDKEVGEKINPESLESIEWWPEAVPAPIPKWQTLSTRVFMDFKAVGNEVAFVTSPRVTGTAKTWRHDKGFGFITGPDGVDIFCHVSAVRDGDCLLTGAKVQYSPTKNKKGGMVALNVTGGATATESERTPEPLASAVVSWWNVQKGFGKIQPDGKDELVFVHVSKLQNADSLVEGQRVKFRSRDGKATVVIADLNSPVTPVRQIGFNQAPRSYNNTPRGYNDTPRGYGRGRSHSRYGDRGTSRWGYGDRGRSHPGYNNTPRGYNNTPRGYNNAARSHGRGGSHSGYGHRGGSHSGYGHRGGSRWSHVDRDGSHPRYNNTPRSYGDRGGSHLGYNSTPRGYNAAPRGYNNTPRGHGDRGGSRSGYGSRGGGRSAM